MKTEALLWLLVPIGTIWALHRQALRSLFQRSHVLGRTLEPDDLGCRASWDPYVSWGTNTHETKIAECLRSGTPFLLVGNEASGKSSVLLRCFRSLHPLVSIVLSSPALLPYGVGGSAGHLIGRSIRLKWHLWRVPWHWSASHWIVLNLTPGMATDAFFDVLRELQTTRLPVAATCRREDLAKIESEDRTHQLERFTRVEIPLLSSVEGRRICTALGLRWEAIEPSFKGTIGSIVHAGKPIREIVVGLTEDARAVLAVFQDLHLCGLDEDNGLFKLADARRLWLSRTGEAAGFDRHAEVLMEQGILTLEDDLHRVSLDVLSVAAGKEHQAAEPRLILQLKGVFTDDEEALYRLGREAKRLRFYDAAIECFEEWHQRSGNVFALLSLGATYGLKKDYDKAISWAEEAAHLWIWRPWIRQRVRTYAHNNLGTYFAKKYEEGGSTDQSLKSAAVKAFEQAQVINPNYAPSWYELGAFYQRLGNNAAAEPCLIRGAKLEGFENPATNWILEKVLEANGRNPEALGVLREMEVRTRENVPRAKVLARMSEVLIKLHDERREAGLLQQAIEKAMGAADADGTNWSAWHSLMFARLLGLARLDFETLSEISETFRKAKEAVRDAPGLTQAVRGSLRGWVRRRMETDAFASRADFDEQLATWNRVMGRDLNQTAESIQNKILQKHPEIGSLRGYQIVFGQPNLFGRGVL